MVVVLPVPLTPDQHDRNGASCARDRCKGLFDRLRAPWRFRWPGFRALRQAKFRGRSGLSATAARMRDARARRFGPDQRLFELGDGLGVELPLGEMPVRLSPSAAVLRDRPCFSRAKKSGLGGVSHIAHDRHPAPESAAVMARAITRARQSRRAPPSPSSAPARSSGVRPTPAFSISTCVPPIRVHKMAPPARRRPCRAERRRAP